MESRQMESSSIPGSEQPGHDPLQSDVEQASPGSTVDVDALAQRVYALLKREVLIERERIGRRPLL
jgi:hypothetical protein